MMRLQKNNTLAFCAILTLALGVAVPQPACGTLYSVDFNDFNGPHWTGIVDTTSDTLTITKWVQNPSGLVDEILIIGGPISDVLPATTQGERIRWDPPSFADAPYDVPDNWDGKIGSDWAFIPKAPGMGPVLAPFYAGWGGALRHCLLF